MVDGYKVTYLRPTASATAEKISFGAWLAVSRNGHRVTTLHTSYGLYASQDTLAPIGRFFLERRRVDREHGRAAVGPDQGHLDGHQPQHRAARTARDQG